MRCGSVSLLALTICAAGCGNTADPGPAPTDAVTKPGLVVAKQEAPAPSAPSTRPSATAAPPAPIAPIVAANLHARGTEPFWSAQIESDMLTYTTPEDQNGRKVKVERRDTAIGAVFSGKLDDAELILTLAKRTCNDGMSDRVYPLSAVLTLGSERHQGCAI